MQPTGNGYVTDVSHIRQFWGPVVVDKRVKFRDHRLNRPLQAALSTVFFRDNLCPEVDSDVIFSVDVEYVGTDVRVQFVDSTSNGSRDMRPSHFVTDNDERRLW